MKKVVHFCDVYFKPKEKQRVTNHKTMNAALNPAVDLFRDLQTNDKYAAEL